LCLDATLLAKAPADECYNGIGAPYACGPGSVPKANQAYVWGLTEENDSLWFGTVANTHCLVQGTYLGAIGLGASETSSWVCEFGESMGARFGGLPAAIGDFRPPAMYRYDLDADELTDITPVSPDPRAGMVQATTGIRSAGSLNGIVILAGPSLIPMPPEPSDGRRGINMFAFDAGTGALLGVRNLPEYDDIRSWVEYKGVLYLGVGNSAGGGSVLRWYGDAVDPFQFTRVGDLDTQASNLAIHKKRLYVTTWPDVGKVAGLYMGPKIGKGGLTAADAGSWMKIWEVTDYEPDPVVAATYGGGAVASYKGKLYWGTMHVPVLSLAAALLAHDGGLIDLDTDGNRSVDADELQSAYQGTFRAVSIFRAKIGKKGKMKTELLYGEMYLPVYSPLERAYTVAIDAVHRNRTGKVPQYGSSGFNNPYNAYTWIMSVYGKKLYVGTFDWSYLLNILYSESGFEESSPIPLTVGPAYLFFDPILDYYHRGSNSSGADLYSFGKKGPAVREFDDGIGNITNYGVRTAVSGDALFLGMANPMNLHPDGGWELLELR
jgi:hypothetical protein